MTKLLDELVEVGAKGMREFTAKMEAESRGEQSPDAMWHSNDLTKAVLNAVLPVLYQRLEEADPGPPDGPIFKSVAIMSNIRGQCRIYMRELFKQELGSTQPEV